MKKLMIAVLTGLFVMSLGSLSFAGMMDKLKGKAEEAKEETSEKMENKAVEPKKSIEAKDATKEESSSTMDKAKGKVKEAVEDKMGGLGK